MGTGYLHPASFISQQSRPARRGALMKLLALLCLSWGATVPAAHQSSCTTSDDNLIALQHTICASLACNSESCPCGNITAAGDWPTQSIYMKNMLDALIDPETCLNTTTAKEIVAWMDVTDVNSSFWWWTWLVFQVQYYDMPRSPGDRIESPATLGRKCWAFAYFVEVRTMLKHRTNLDPPTLYR